MRLKYGLIIGFLALATAVQFSCIKEKAPAPQSPVTPSSCSDVISYSNQIQPLLDVNCSTSGCHDATGSGGVVLLTYAEVSLNANKILSTIRHDPGFVQMPQGSPQLADSLIQQVDCWIQQGKQDN